MIPDKAIAPESEQSETMGEPRDIIGVALVG